MSITGTTDVTVGPAHTSTVGTYPTAHVGVAFTLDATVSGPGGGSPTGTVTFTNGASTVCMGPLVSGSVSCQGMLNTAGTYMVTASYSGDSNFASSSQQGDVAVSAIAPNAPNGATSTDSNSSPNNTGTVSASVANIEAVGQGPGALTVATYGGNPTGGQVPVPRGTGVFYDTATGPGSNFSSVTITVCQQGPANQLDWFNGTAWVAFSLQSSGACLGATVTSSTSPGLSQLTGTPIALATKARSGYDLVGSDGGVFVFPTGQSGGFYGSLPSLRVHVSNVVGIVPSADFHGYFLVGSDGGVFSFGDTHFVGSLPGIGVRVGNIVGIVPTTDDRGYFLVGSDGGVFSFGDSAFEGSLPGKGQHVNDVVGIAATPTDRGYWVVERSGTVTAFGDAPSLGSAHGLGSSAVGVASTSDGGGYWVVAANGAVASFGDATAYGSLPALKVTPAQPVVGLVPTADGHGYWLIAKDGGVFAFGDAPSVGSLPGLHAQVSNIVGAVPTIAS
jgi:hypothetical protein